MLNDEIKKQARDIARENELLDSDEKTITLGVSEASLDAMPEDARALWDAAMEKELLRREGTLEENDKKYEAAMVNMVLDKDGNLEAKIQVGRFRYNFDTLEPEFKLNAFGYDRLPPDIQKEFGERDEVIGNWVTVSDEQLALYDAFVEYAHHNNEGYKTWEEYRDAKGFGKQEEITIEPAQDVDGNAPPRETPTVEQDETLNLNK